MGFERVTAIIQGTKNLVDFSKTISNYETDIFRPIFDDLEKLSGKEYASTLPDRSQPFTLNSQQATDVAFRVIADHIRALSFAIADGIIPSNEGRGYVLRRILRRAVRYGRTLGFHEPFFFNLVDVVAKTMGDVFPEIRARQKIVEQAIRREEEAFNKTLDAGLAFFEITDRIRRVLRKQARVILDQGDARELDQRFNRDDALERIYQSARLASDTLKRTLSVDEQTLVESARKQHEESEALVKYGYPIDTVKGLAHEEIGRLVAAAQRVVETEMTVSGIQAFVLYDTYGFPLDLTELMARERGLIVDVAGFEELMKEQRERARKAQKKDSIEIANIQPLWGPTQFVGYNHLSSDGGHFILDNDLLYVEASPFYAEMGGQVGDTGWVESTTGARTRVINTVRTPGGVHVLKLANPEIFEPADSIPSRYIVDADRRRAIQGHHTVTHLLHWALHEVVSRDAAQKGSYVGPDKLTFDFSSVALTKQQVREIEKLVNEKITEDAPVSWTEIPFAEAKQRKDIIQFFGEKYGDTVRVLQIGGAPRVLNGYSMELCGGTHVRSTAEIGPFWIVKEEAIAAGIRRIEAVAGDAARKWAEQEAARQEDKFATLARKKPDIADLPIFENNADTAEMLKQIDARARHLEKLESEIREWEKKSSKAAEAELKSRAARIATELAAFHAGENFCVSEVPNADGKLLQAIVDAVRAKFNGPIFLVSAANGVVALVVSVPKEMTSKFQANKIIQEIAPIVGGKGGGRPDSAQGAGKDAGKVDMALAKAKELLS
jgi:alanyl-tRNA synthetase